MKRITIAKISEISVGVVFILLGMLMFGLGYISMMYGEGGMPIELMLLFMAICGIEGGVFWIRRFYKMEGGLEIKPPKRFVAKLASNAVYLLFAITIVRIIFAIAGFAVAYYLLIKYMAAGWQNLDMTWAIIYAGLVVIYFALFRTMFKKRFVETAQEMVNKTIGDYPMVEVKDNDLVLHLGKGYPENVRDLHVSMDKIEEVKVLDRYQGMGLVRYVLGPDVEFGVKSVKDKMDYMQGKIDRPKFFSYLENASGAKTLYLAGEDVLYLVGVHDNEGLQKLKNEKVK